MALAPKPAKPLGALSPAAAGAPKPPKPPVPVTLSKEKGAGEAVPPKLKSEPTTALKSHVGVVSVSSEAGDTSGT